MKIGVISVAIGLVIGVTFGLFVNDYHRLKFCELTVIGGTVLGEPLCTGEVVLYVSENDPDRIGLMKIAVPDSDYTVSRDETSGLIVTTIKRKDE